MIEPIAVGIAAEFLQRSQFLMEVFDYVLEQLENEGWNPRPHPERNNVYILYENLLNLSTEKTAIDAIEKLIDDVARFNEYDDFLITREVILED